MVTDMLDKQLAFPTTSCRRMKDQLWSINLQFISGLDKLAKIERAITPGNFKPRGKPIGGYVYPCRLSKIIRGKLHATRKYVDKAEAALPGSSYHFYHPFWDLLENTSLNTSDIISVIRDLRTKPANTLLINNQQLADEFLLSIEKKSNFDALAAILGVCQICLRSVPKNKELLLKVFSHMIIIFTRISAQLPFYYISDNLYKYLKYHYFDLIKDEEKWTYQTEEDYVFQIITIERFMIKIVEQLDILKYPFVPPSCLHIVESHLTEPVMNKLLNRDIVTSDGTLKDKGSIKQWPEIQALTAELQKWERKEHLIQ